MQKTKPKMPPYAEGSSAYWAGASDSENPYPKTSGDYIKWRMGWVQACEDDARDCVDDMDDF